MLYLPVNKVKMIAKLKIKSSQHPALDAVCEKYKLTLQNLFTHEGADELIKKVEYNSATNAGRELKDCPDVLEMYVECETPNSPL
jgi:hypothetical protein